MCSTSGNCTYHVINKPYNKGASCDFVVNGVQIPPPHTASLVSLPNHPQWRVDENEKCNANTIAMFSEPVYTYTDWGIVPNPAKKYTQVRLRRQVTGQLMLISATGEIVSNQSIDGSKGQLTFSP